MSVLAWWRRLSAKHTSPWPPGELESMRRDPVIGPALPPAKRAKWDLEDRQNDPALSGFRLFPAVSPVPHVLDDMPHS